MFSIFKDSISPHIAVQKEYYLNRKNLHKHIFEESMIFCRIEVNETIVNKSTGLKYWIGKSGFEKKDSGVIHIGDKDSGVVNDTIIKSEIPNSVIIMVGNDFDKTNPLIDAYFEEDVDDGVGEILKTIEEV